MPTYGCYKDLKIVNFNGDVDRVVDNFWNIGGDRGWYYANWLWSLRGFLDRLVGGVGLRRGRTPNNMLESGDVLDFWRVVYASKQDKRWLLYAEMKLPGEAWLEFNVSEVKDRASLIQAATFRPKALWGRLYWYLSYPFHIFIFGNMAKGIVRYNAKEATQ